ncbi:hypothetical protein Arnit_2940 [Arcobacter nitrofigilis DSM 7299]|uniref:Spore protein YkvP/CgeB glycosyl transferase-like domain-containing protein n=1 Tax=Arcobacter nitrofigilis (strain ATCC 33309 / DSM 7299 / CCUG 15893 / LMG 7604 / NCTC 12251 / CI) TaxID=572480 RepID=D5V7G8_ARCNC|nr:glycosyltransferase [Arcobacter nitrofigilis]ADG94588.1 hypothetical protein Arnit_2940 [Arcobacter nitrofigilis DSM 7299]
MNILILTRIMAQNNNTIYNSYTNGIKNNSDKCISFDYYDLYFNNGKKRFEEIILNEIEVNNIDVVFINFVSGDLTFDIYFLQELSKKCFLITNFYDSELFFEPIDRYYAQCADLVLLPTPSNFLYSYKLLEINAITTYSLYDSKIYKCIEKEKDIDISFIGDMTKKFRKEFVSYLESNGYKVETYGFGTKNGRIDFEHMLEIINRSKINLNFTDSSYQRTFNRDTNMNYLIIPNIVKYIKQLKGRVIEIALCKGFVLSQSINGLDEIFSREEIGVFDTKEELLEKVKYYLDNEKIREKMASLAHINAMDKFDATIKFKELFKSIDLKKRNNKIIYMDKIFLENYMSHHTLYLFNFLFKLQISKFLEEVRIIEFNKINLTITFNHFVQQFKYQIINKLFKRK